MTPFLLASLTMFLPVRLDLNKSTEGVAHTAIAGRRATDRFRMSNS